MEEVQRVLQEAVAKVVGAPQGWGVWILRTPSGWEVSGLVTRGTQLRLGDGERAVMWLEIAPQNAPYWPESWGNWELLAEAGAMDPEACRGDYGDCLDAIQRALRELEERAAEGDRAAEETLFQFLESAREALAWEVIRERAAEAEGALGDELIAALYRLGRW